MGDTRTGMWVLAFRNFNYSHQNTTSAVEGYHGALKQLDLNYDRKRLVGRRLDWLIRILLSVTEERYRVRHQLKRAGYVRNKKAEAAVRASITAAREVDSARVVIVDRATGSADVSSPTHVPGYMVAGALTAHPICSCPCGIRGAICKHLVKVMRVLGKSEPDILQAWGTLRGTDFGDKFVAGWMSAAAPAAEPGSTEQGGGVEHTGGPGLAGGAEQAGSVCQRQCGGTQRQLAVTGAGSSAPGRTAAGHEAAIDAAMERMKARLKGQSVSQWEAAAGAVAALESTVGVLTARTNMFGGSRAPVPLQRNPNGPESMSLLRLKSFVEPRGGASRSSSQRSSQPRAAVAVLEGPSDAASAKRPLPVVPLAPARQARAKKARCLSQQVASQLGPKVGHSQGLPLPEAPPPVSGLLQQAAQQQQQQPVAESQVEWGDLFDFALEPLLM